MKYKIPGHAHGARRDSWYAHVQQDVHSRVRVYTGVKEGMNAEGAFTKCIGQVTRNKCRNLMQKLKAHLFAMCAVAMTGDSRAGHMTRVGVLECEGLAGYRRMIRRDTE